MGKHESCMQIRLETIPTANFEETENTDLAQRFKRSFY